MYIYDIKQGFKKLIRSNKASLLCDVDFATQQDTDGKGLRNKFQLLTADHDFSEIMRSGKIIMTNYKKLLMTHQSVLQPIT